MKKDELIQQILALEWPMFQQVRNRHGRAACQDDERTFTIMRLSQFAAWDEATLTSYYQDLLATKKDGRNIMTEKYGYMMAWTHADEFQLREHGKTAARPSDTAPADPLDDGNGHSLS